MRIASWNVNGIRAVEKKGCFQPFLSTLNPDVVCLQETKAEQSQVDIDIPGYEEYWLSASKKGYAGTAILSKVKPISVSTGLPSAIAKKFHLASDPVGDANLEGRVVTAEFDQFFLVNCYTPNVRADLRRLEPRHTIWDPAFLAHLTALKKKKGVVVCGDLNVAHQPEDLANPKSNVGKPGYTSEEREGIQKIIDSGFVDSFRLFTSGSGHYTWWSERSGARARNVGWRIDYFLASKNLVPKIKAAEIHAQLMGSDHCPVSITLDIR